MQILERDGLAENPWQRINDEAPLPGGPVLISLSRWRAERGALIGSVQSVGLMLQSEESPDLIAEDLGRFALICFDFPKFTDGRGFSHARMLRERFGFRGEIRAAGHVLRDQAGFLFRCGFDSIEIANGEDVAGWLAAINEISVRYQPDRRATNPAAVAAGGWAY